MKALRIRSMLMGAGVLLGAMGAGAKTTDAVNVSYQWKKDAKAYYRWTEMTDMAMSSDAGMTSKTQNGRVSTVTWLVQEVDAAGVATIKMTYNAAAMTAQFQRTAEPMKWDSLVPATTDETSPVAMIFGHLIGESITFTVDAHGVVSKVTGIDELGKKLKKAAVDTPGAGTFVNGIQTAYTETQMKANLERVLSGLPPAAVKVNDTWSDEFSLPYAQLGSLKLVRTHTLASVEGTKITIGTDVKIALAEPKEGDPAKAMFAMMSPELKTGTGKGTRLMEAGKGFPDDSKLELTMDLAMSGGGMKMNSATTMTFHLERLEQLPPGAVIPGETPIPQVPVPPAPRPAAPIPTGDVNLTPKQNK